MDQTRRLARQEAMWVLIAPQLRRTVRRSAAPADLDDVIQDVAERFFREPRDFPTSDDGLAWARLVARRRLIDMSRRVRAIPSSDLRGPNSADAERTALGHLALDCARGFMRDEGIRESWITGGDGVDAVPPRERMRRSRARRRLADHLRQKVGWPALIPRLRWFAPALGAAVVFPLPFMMSPKAPEPAREKVSSPSAAADTEPRPAIEWRSGPIRFVASVTAQDGQAVPRRPAEPRRVADAPLPWGGARVNERQTPDEDPEPLLCLKNLRVIPDSCVEHPLR